MNILPRRPQAPSHPREHRRWTATEEDQVIHLRDTQNASFDAIGIAINRSPTAVRSRYSTLRQQESAAAIAWTPALDAAIISGRQRHLSSFEISNEMKIPCEAVQERWRHLRANKLIPEKVLAGLQRKEKVRFTEWEDEAILRLWIRGLDDRDITDRLAGDILLGKSKADIMARRKQLTNGSPMYLRMLGLQESKVDAEGSLATKFKYEWQK